MKRKPYPTDLTDDQWERVAPLLPKPKSGTPKGGRPAHDTREILNAIFYLLRGGQAWRMLPHDFPPWQTVYTRFRLWRLADRPGDGHGPSLAGRPSGQTPGDNGNNSPSLRTGRSRLPQQIGRATIAFSAPRPNEWVRSLREFPTTTSG